MNSIGLTPFEVIDGGNVYTEDREDKASSLEFSTPMPYQPFSWDEGNVVENVYHTMYASILYSIWISRESSFLSIPLVNIVDASGFHHCLVDASGFH
jgi:hypothetical protein